MVCALHWKHFIYKMRQLVLTFFSIYINYLEDDLSSNPNLLADDTSFFSAVRDKMSQPKTSMMTYRRYVPGLINEK